MKQKEIKIKLTLGKLEIACNLILCVDTKLWARATPEQRASYSLTYLLSKKLRKKLIDKEGISLDKTFTVKLIYHEAYALYIILENTKHCIDSTDVHSNVCVQDIISNLHKELI